LPFISIYFVAIPKCECAQYCPLHLNLKSNSFYGWPSTNPTKNSYFSSSSNPTQ